MKRLVIATSAVVIFAASYVVISTEVPNRPTGVTAKDWITVSDSLGIVLVNRSDSRPVEVPSGVALLKPPVGGYFMVKGASGWTRLVIAEPIKGPADAG